LTIQEEGGFSLIEVRDSGDGHDDRHLLGGDLPDGVVAGSEHVGEGHRGRGLRVEVGPRAT
jgi:hypothetical protein